MPRSLDVHLLPGLVAEEALAGRTAVVIDVLRATTTMVHALAAGAEAIYPCRELNDAFALAIRFPGQAVLGGERGGLRIEGFDLGNSPAEYTPAVLAGKVLVFTTTNGTRALGRCHLARRVLAAAFVNFSAICRELAEEEAVSIVCAGTDGQITREDVLLAGALADDLARTHPDFVLNDQAEIAADAWRFAIKSLTGLAPLLGALRASQGGRNLIDIGQENDIELACQIDRFDIVPEYDHAAGRLARR